MKYVLAMVILAIAATSVVAQQPKTTPTARPVGLTIDRYDGSFVTTDLGYGITLNKGSSLKREWFVIRDDKAPALIDGAAGISVIYKAGERSSLSQYQYRVNYSIKPLEPILAFEIRVHVLDVFGRLLRTLSSTELVDLSDARLFDGTWRILSENEASEAFASIAYVAQVRTAAGRVYEADRTAIFDQVRKVGKRVTESELEPKRETPSKP